MGYVERRSDPIPEWVRSSLELRPGVRLQVSAEDDKRIRASPTIKASCYSGEGEVRGFVSLQHDQQPKGWKHFFGELLLAFAVEPPMGQALELVFIQYFYPDRPAADGKELDAIYKLRTSKSSFKVEDAKAVEYRAPLFSPPPLEPPAQAPTGADEEWVLCYDVYRAF